MHVSSFEQKINSVAQKEQLLNLHYIIDIPNKIVIISWVFINVLVHHNRPLSILFEWKYMHTSGLKIGKYMHNSGLNIRWWKWRRQKLLCNRGSNVFGKKECSSPSSEKNILTGISSCVPNTVKEIEIQIMSILYCSQRQHSEGVYAC